MNRPFFPNLRIWIPFIALWSCAGNAAHAIDALDDSSATLPLQTVNDTWNRAVPRWRDIANAPYDPAFRATFSYDDADVKLTYQRAPKARTFVGHISARGLKPNFAYQMKLAGKPVTGPQGWGTARSYVAASSTKKGALARPVNFIGSAIGGDDWTNQQLGYAGRWWDDTRAPSTNLNDAYFRANARTRSLYGYIFMGDFVTDADGNAEADVRGDGSYHITWQDAQLGAYKDELFGTFSARQTTYGYAAPAPAEPVKLWYERERGRAQPVQLARGVYHCRLLLTEEAFHAEGGEWGGVWQTILATEKVGDVEPGNDVVFTIR